MFLLASHESWDNFENVTHWRGSHKADSKIFHLALSLLAVLNFQNKWSDREIAPAMTPAIVCFFHSLHYLALSSSRAFSYGAPSKNEAWVDLSKGGIARIEYSLRSRIAGWCAFLQAKKIHEYMAHQARQREDHYESIIEAYNRGELWPTGSCRSTGCSAENPVNIESFRERMCNASDQATARWSRLA